MHFLSRTQIIAALIAVALVFVVLDLVRRRRLSEEYSFLWIGSTVVVAFLAFATPVLQAMTRLFGVLYESSMVFATGLAFATVMLLYLSVKLSRLGEENQALARELALLRHEFERSAGGPPPAARGEGA